MSEQVKDPEPPKLLILERDLDLPLQGMLKSIAEGKRVLGGSDDVRQVLFDALPSIIAKRVKAITPPDFVISELELKMSLEGTVFGVGLSGDLTVKLAPQK